MPAADQAATAQAGWGARTFVTSEAELTTPVDAHAHDFVEPEFTESPRVVLNATIPISEFQKTEAPPAGLAKGKPVTQTVAGAPANCEIGVIKTGDDKVQVDHFKKV